MSAEELISHLSQDQEYAEANLKRVGTLRDQVDRRAYESGYAQCREDFAKWMLEIIKDGIV